MTRLSPYARSSPLLPIVMVVVVAVVVVITSPSKDSLDIGRRRNAHYYRASAFPHHSSTTIATPTTMSTSMTMFQPGVRRRTRGRGMIHPSSSSSSSSSSLTFSPVVDVVRASRVAVGSVPPAPPDASATRLHSFFGLGPAEATIILVAGLFVMGPSKLLQYSRDVGIIAGKSIDGVGDEWRDGLSSIPEEFGRGLEEGEIDARGRRARRMDDVDGDIDDRMNDRGLSSR
jgi:Sec-independent protein translocase protein TatA